MFEEENVNAGRAAELRKQNNFLRNENKFLKNNMKNNAPRGLRNGGAWFSFVGVLFLILIFMSVFQVLNTPGKELPSFATLIDFLSLTDNMTIKNVSFGDELDTFLEGLFKVILPDVWAEALANWIGIWFIPLNLVYFVLANLWNIVIYAFTLYSWFTGLPIPVENVGGLIVGGV